MHGESFAVGLLVVVEVCVATEDLYRVAVLSCSEDILFLVVVPHLARESRAAYVASAARPTRSLNVAEILPVAVAIVVASELRVDDIVIDWALKDLGG